MLSSWYVLQISKQQLQTIKDRFQAFLNGETQIVADEAFINAVQSYYEVSRGDFTARMNHCSHLFYGQGHILNEWTVCTSHLPFFWCFVDRVFPFLTHHKICEAQGVQMCCP